MHQCLSVIRGDLANRISGHLINELGLTVTKPISISWHIYAEVMVKYGYEAQLGSELINTIIYG